jgi:hypothetical protein
MDKLACLMFVLNSESVEDRVKMAAVQDYACSIADESDKLAELEDVLKEAGLWSSLAPKLVSWGKKIAPKAAAFSTSSGGWRGRLGNWLQRIGNTQMTRAMGSKGMALVPTAAGSAASGAARSGFGRWAKPLAVGGTIGGAGLLAGQMGRNSAYRQGYGTAVNQLSPMVSALYAPQGRMSMRSPMNMA